MIPKKSLQSTTNTRERILHETARLFATGSFASVTMRDIAVACKIQPSSIYNYFESKEKLLEAILQRFRLQFRDYFARLDLAMREEPSFERVMESMFSHLTGDADDFMYYGLSIVMVEQFHNELARQIVFDLFYVESVARVRNTLDRCRERDMVPKQDTGRVANFFVYFLMIGNVLRIHQYMGSELPVDCRQLTASFQQFLTRAIVQGV